MGRIIISFVLQEFQCKTRKSDEIIAKTTYYIKQGRRKPLDIKAKESKMRITHSNEDDDDEKVYI